MEGIWPRVANIQETLHQDQHTTGAAARHRDCAMDCTDKLPPKDGIILYYLYHRHQRPDLNLDDSKLIGVYSSLVQALSAIARAQLLSGFCEQPLGFHIVPVEVDRHYF